MSSNARATWDLLVIANPVWETSWLVGEVPPNGATDFDPLEGAIAKIEDGGGSALNTACALACAGRRVVAVGRVGDDAEGHAAVSALERRGIYPWIEIAPGRTTKRNHVYVGPRGDRGIAFRAFLPPRCAPAWEEAPGEPLTRARILLLDRLAAGAPGWLRARPRPDFVNAFNRNSPPFRGPAAIRFREALPLLDSIQLSEGEDATPHPADARPPAPPDPATREAIHSPPDPGPLPAAEIDAILRAGVRFLVRTRGARGVIVHSPGLEPVEIPATPTLVVDSTGAGDAFAAGFLDGLLDGAQVVDAARRGVDWGARACRHLGARGWLDREPPEKR